LSQNRVSGKKGGSILVNPRARFPNGEKSRTHQPITARSYTKAKKKHSKRRRGGKKNLRRERIVFGWRFLWLKLGEVRGEKKKKQGRVRANPTGIGTGGRQKRVSRVGGERMRKVWGKVDDTAGGEGALGVFCAREFSKQRQRSRTEGDRAGRG